MQQVTHETKQESGVIAIPTLNQFIEKCLDFNEYHPEVDISKFPECPVEVFAASVNKPCKTTVAGIRYCPMCGKAMCPSCGSHNVTQLSRTTGYIQAVSGWNDGKKQELKDRQRYNIGIGGHASNARR